MPGVTAEPLAFAEDLRLDVDGVPAIDGLTLRTRASRVLVLGAPRALFEGLCGIRPVVRGTLRVQGTPASLAAREGIIAGAPLDPPLPPKWTALEYVTWSARLTGCSARDARALATEAVERVQLGAMVALPLAGLVPHARRGVVLAAALATGAAVIAVEDPLASLPEEIARAWARIVVSALEGRAWIVLAPRIALTSPLAMHAEEGILANASRVEAQGPPAEIAATSRRFVARIHGPLEGLAARVAERGGRMEVQGAQVMLELAESFTTTELLRLCTETEATVVELVPISRALT